MLKPSLNSSSPLIVILCATLLVGTIAASSKSSPNELPAGPGKGKAEAACLTCHEARIIVQQRLSKATWTKEVDKMVKWGANVDPNDRDVLIDYLSSNFSPDKSPYQAPKSVAALRHKSTENR